MLQSKIRTTDSIERKVQRKKKKGKSLKFARQKTLDNRNLIMNKEL